MKPPLICRGRLYGEFEDVEYAFPRWVVPTLAIAALVLLVIVGCL